MKAVCIICITFNIKFVGETVNTASCGNGEGCSGVCGEETDYAIVNTPNGTNANAFQSISCEEITEFAASSGRVKRCVCNTPIWNLWYCPHKINTASKIATYPICCLHIVCHSVPGVTGTLGVCCKNHGLCF